MQILKQSLLLLAAFAVGLSAASLEEAKQLLADGKLDEGQKVLEQVISAEPDFAQAHYALGGVFVERKDYEGAEREFARVEEQGHPALALIGRGRIQLAQEHGAEAKELFKQAQEQTPPAQEFIDRMQAADSDEAKAIVRAEAAPVAELNYHRGLANALLRDYAASAADLETSMKLDPANAKAHYYAGLAYNALKRPDMMVSHFQTYLTMEPESPESARVRSVLRGVR